MVTDNLRSIIENTVPISNFNKGMAGKIFADVRSNGSKIVIKNNVPECVLMSPEQYIELMDKIEDMQLMLLAQKRMANDTSEKLHSADAVMKEFNITDGDLDGWEDVDIE